MITMYMCMTITCFVDGQLRDIQTPKDRMFGHPINDIDKRTYKSSIGGPDRFRFYYIGLGKRSGKDLTENQGFNPHDMAIYKFSKNNHDPISLFDVWKISKQNGPGLTNDHLLNTMIYRRMLSNAYDKRDPELFTEDLYPIQSGKQLFETYIDSALDQMQRWAEETSQNGEILDKISAVEMAKQFSNDTNDYLITESLHIIDNEPPKSEIKTQSFDLTFSSPDMSSYLLHHTRDSIDKAEASGDTKEKKWWAADRLNEFRLPKSKWSPRAGKNKHVDPAFYFIGLGRK
ncbi:uncharacterized protein LOC127858356 [Dreissena polymorpha]|nr:uncharacterized protein LOC127858356 [Dreissena polymorpha]